MARNLVHGVVVLAEDAPATCKLAEIAIDDIRLVMEFWVDLDG